MQKIKGKHIQVHVAEFNDLPKQDEIALRQTSETIGLLKKASGMVERITEKF